jgi:ribosomal protein S18 acetylase RimI-like enzyme
MIDFLNSLGGNLLVAAIGGGITLGVKYLVERIKQKRLENKYPISGNYISSFEDVLNGEKVITKAPVSLQQDGLNVTGTTMMDGRTWILEGDISTDGYLHGVYHAESVRDKGVGNFFLEISIDGNMDGLWSGYDSINKSIQSGSYSFVKQPLIKITAISDKQVPALLNIAEKNLGEAYIEVDDLKNKEGIALAATNSGKLVGFCTGKKVAVSELFKNIPQLAQKKLKQLQVVDEVGMVASIATDSAETGKGIGTKLLSECASQLQNMGLNVLVMTGWKSEKGVHIGSLAKKLGFEEMLEIENFWYEDSKANGYRCPSCGEPPCECSAVVFIKHSHE